MPWWYRESFLTTVYILTFWKAGLYFCQHSALKHLNSSFSTLGYMPLWCGRESCYESWSSKLTTAVDLNLNFERNKLNQRKMQRQGSDPTSLEGWSFGECTESAIIRKGGAWEVASLDLWPGSDTTGNDIKKWCHFLAKHHPQNIQASSPKSPGISWVRFGNHGITFQMELWRGENNGKLEVN